MHPKKLINNPCAKWKNIKHIQFSFLIFHFSFLIFHFSFSSSSPPAPHPATRPPSHPATPPSPTSTKSPSGNSSPWPDAPAPPPPPTSITLSFNPEAGTLRGQSSCNTYSADYTLSHSSTPSSSPSATLRLSNLTHTDIQCTEAQMNTEERFLALLAKANHLSLSPDGWTLTLSAKGRNPLVFSLQ